eukprot:CAMPEP_0206522740 /NCGR_PEP_ID=MMETSP0324_2-20121206/67160_1 /ASSEMBLY_ACC=CAM_ASM_000836 /TAXON_ID=2866 /ORGANISM="Crypthecodinium cohnii, Strain Seligo" /LENGTH=46 /DNA_ID= /DNA_START= /DNA_END= /DNA_ORIENTATION=
MAADHMLPLGNIALSAMLQWHLPPQAAMLRWGLSETHTRFPGTPSP